VAALGACRGKKAYGAALSPSAGAGRRRICARFEGKKTEKIRTLKAITASKRVKRVPFGTTLDTLLFFFPKSVDIRGEGWYNHLKPLRGKKEKEFFKWRSSSSFPSAAPMCALR
jgi:hypothetical protein